MPEQGNARRVKPFLPDEIRDTIDAAVDLTEGDRNGWKECAQAVRDWLATIPTEAENA